MKMHSSDIANVSQSNKIYEIEWKNASVERFSTSYAYVYLHAFIAFPSDFWYWIHLCIYWHSYNVSLHGFILAFVIFVHLCDNNNINIGKIVPINNKIVWNLYLLNWLQNNCMRKKGFRKVATYARTQTCLHKHEYENEQKNWFSFVQLI